MARGFYDCVFCLLGRQGGVAGPSDLWCLVMRSSISTLCDVRYRGHTRSGDATCSPLLPGPALPLRSGPRGTGHGPPRTRLEIGVCLYAA